MEVKPGYKQTEVGVIPEDWEVIEIGNVAQVFGRIGFRGYTVNDIVKQGHGAISISPSNIQGGKTDFSACTYISWRKYEESPEIQIRNGDILLVKTGSTVGKTAIIHDLPESATVNPQIVVLKNIKVDNSYLGYSAGFKTVQTQISATVVGGAIPTLSQREIAKFKFAVPPTKDEQQAIAETLGDADALIESLEQLLAKKRNLKQGTMQELLSGKKRLPGFSGDWVTKPFDIVLVRINAKAHQIQASDYQPTGQFPVVDQGKGLVIGYSDRIDKRFVCPDGGVIIFGDHTCIVKFVDFNFLVGADGTQVLQAKTGQCTSFHALQLQHKGISPTGYNRHFKFLKERDFACPPMHEQESVAAILSNMDAEIAKLETKLTKARQLKTGMMQELLTGRIRLI